MTQLDSGNVVPVSLVTLRVSVRYALRALRASIVLQHLLNRDRRVELEEIRIVNVVLDVVYLSLNRRTLDLDLVRVIGVGGRTDDVETGIVVVVPELVPLVVVVAHEDGGAVVCRIADEVDVVPAEGDDAPDVVGVRVRGVRWERRLVRVIVLRIPRVFIVRNRSVVILRRTCSVEFTLENVER